jgi:uncharacterized protein YqhQ
VSKCLDVGGQAVIEGVMMRGPGSMVIAVRRADGSIVVKDSEWVPLTRRWKFLKWPVIRGAIVMIEALMNGMQSLSFSAEIAMKDEELAAGSGDSSSSDAAVESSDTAIESQESDETLSEDSSELPTGVMTQGAIALSLTLSFAMGIGLFIYLPHATASVLMNLVGGLPLTEAADVNSPLFHTLVGGIKMTIFICYILLIRRMPDIYRVFQYHGAEHKSIHTYEARQELTVANARTWPTFHPRCGTSFLVFVIIISIGFFAAAFPLIGPLLFPEGLEGWRLSLLQASVKIPMMVPIAGLSYEFIKWAGRQKDSPFLKLLSVPGQLVQKLTTIEPDDEQLEVALVSLKRSLQREGELEDPSYDNCHFLPAA